MILLYTATIFVSAFLLFLVQPLFARMVLPMLGGTPNVWNTALMFYQAVLLLGYGYAHLVSKFPVRRQVQIHAILLLLPLALLPIGIRTGEPVGGANPIGWLLLTMLASVGLPFFVVSSTSPLIQRWYASTSGRGAGDPYFLYAASNVGSLIALIGYPLLFEPQLRLASQSVLWAVGYVLFVALMIGCGVALFRHPGALSWKAPETKAEETGRLAAPTWQRKVRWVLLAFVPSSLMIGATTYMSTDIASIPMLWVVPLALYLLSFILVFARHPLIPHKWMVAILPPLLVVLILALAIPLLNPRNWLFAVHLVTFFVAAMVCHGEIAADRPSVQHLTGFYFLMSVGGVLGGFFNAIVAPLAFRSVLEYPLTVLLACMLLPTAMKKEKDSPQTLALDFVGPLTVASLAAILIRYQESQGITTGYGAWTVMYLAPGLMCLLFVKRPHRFALAVFALYMIGVWQQRTIGTIIHQERGFFGVLRVREAADKSFRVLLHGTTLHGVQLTDPKYAHTPTSYYFPSGPVGEVFGVLNLDGAAIAAVGLGVGSLAGYSQAGQTWHFYEIDPQVEHVARDPRYFTYLRDSPADPKVILGDARLSLAASPQSYKLIVLDAYSSDSIPTHLITREALAMYLRHLEPEGILAFHISNKHLDLEPVLGRLAEDAGLISLTRNDKTTPEERQLQKASSTWTVMARTPQDLGEIARDSRWHETQIVDSVPLWTDDYSSVLSVLKKL